MSKAVNKPTSEDLKTLGSLQVLSAEDATTLGDFLEAFETSAGKALWSEGESSHFAAFILKGTVEEQKATEFANTQFVVGVYGPGSLVGVNNLLENAPRPLSAICLEDTRLLKLPAERFDNLQQEHPQLAIKIYQRATRTLSIRLNKAFDRLAAIF